MLEFEIWWAIRSTEVRIMKLILAQFKLNISKIMPGQKTDKGCEP